MTGWTKVSLGDLCAGGVFVDGDWVESKDQDSNGSVRLTQLADVGVGTFRNRSDRWMREDQAQALNCTFLRPDDVLVARMPDPIGRACVVPLAIGRAVTAVDVAILRPPTDVVDRRYLMWAINAPQTNTAIASLQSGTTRKRVSRKNLATVTIPLPELDQQRRIVEILEDHLSRLDAAADYVSAAQCRTTTLAESALASNPLLSGCPDLRLGDVLAEGLSNGRSVPTASEGFPVLRLTALGGDGTIDLTARKIGRWTAATAVNFLVSSGDVFVARGNGSIKLVGKGGLVREVPDPVAFPDTMIRVRCDPTRVDPEFFVRIWNSRSVRAQIEAVARTTAGIYKVNQKDLGMIEFPLPTIADQRMIVRSQQEVEMAADRLSRTLMNADRRGVQLRRAVLAAAFSGKLTGRRTDNEHIEELAEAIG